MKQNGAPIYATKRSKADVLLKRLWGWDLWGSSLGWCSAWICRAGEFSQNPATNREIGQNCVLEAGAWCGIFYFGSLSGSHWLNAGIVKGAAHTHTHTHTQIELVQPQHLKPPDYICTRRLSVPKPHQSDPNGSSRGTHWLYTDANATGIAWKLGAELGEAKLSELRIILEAPTSRERLQNWQNRLLKTQRSYKRV